jgi:Cu(I)/Ag(I) efflux system membrane fusion protein
MLVIANRTTRTRIGIVLAALALTAGGIGYYFGSTGNGSKATQAPSQGSRKILYWYDPMVPLEHYDHPGLSSMGMQTIPKYADESGQQAGVRVDPAAIQSLGMRVVSAQAGPIGSSLDVPGTIDFDQRHVAIVQARSGGFVQRTYSRAPGDLVSAGAPIADLMIPQWGGAQQEFLAVRRLGDRNLTAASKQRMRLLGMSDSVIARVERTGGTNGVVTISTPISGAIQELNVRPGMTLSAGQTLAQVTSIGTVWLNAAVPEARAGEVRVGQTATANVAAFPGAPFSGRVVAILPTADATSRTITVRIALPNLGLRLRPGMFATVHLGQNARAALLVPTEAVIRTGKRSLVMLAEPGGRFRPAEVEIGRESNGQTEILAGLSPGEKVVASGQFLLDSEASLSGIPARPISGDRK